MTQRRSGTTPRVTARKGPARFNRSITFHDGSTTTHRALAYYRLADGKIVVNDVMFVPDVMLALGPLMAPPPCTQC